MSVWHGYHLPSISDPYVYLQSLITGTYRHIPMREPLVAALANGVLRYNINSLSSTQNIDNSLAFLKNTANIMRKHEFSFINNQIKELESLGKIGTEEQKIIDDLRAIQTGEMDYKVFINGLNSLLTNIKKYQARIKAFNDKSIVNTPQLNMVTNLPTLINDFTNYRKQVYYSQEEIIRQLTLEYISKYGQEFIEEATNNGIQGATDMAAAAALISQQIAQYIYDNKLMKYKRISNKKKGKFSDFSSAEEFINTLQTISSKLDDFNQTHNMSSIFGNQKLLNEIKQMYGIDYDKESIHNNMQATVGASNEIRQLQQILGHDKILGEGSLADEMTHITVKWNSKTQRPLSYVAELTSSLLSNALAHKHLGQQNLGTDILLGTYSIETRTNQNPDAIQQTLEQIASRLSKKKVKDNMNEISKVYTEELNALADKLGNIGKAFILHETTKNYNTLERGQWPGQMNSFSGREMSIFRYIDGIKTLGNNLNIDTEALQFIAYNLASDALGSINKEPLAHILSIFGGIMMFDDFAIIGNELTAQMPSSIENIHLYKLQDTYFPASIFLDATFNAFKELETVLLAGNGFEATIDVPTINYSIEYGSDFEARWEAVKGIAEKNTKIHLHFAANFLSLMAQLL